MSVRGKNGDASPAGAGQPTRRRVATWGACVFLGVAVPYGLMLPPTVTLVDSGELILSSWLPGVAHPPGFPTYLLCGWAASRVPIGSVAQRVAGMSAFFAAVAAVAVFLIPAFGHGRAPAGKANRRRAAQDDLRADPAGGDELGVRAGVALTFGLSLTMGEFATVAEVYTLNVALGAMAMMLVLRWRRRAARTSAHAVKPTWELTAAALFYGLALGNHHVTTVILGPMIAWLLLGCAGRRVFGRPYLGRVGVPLLIGLAVYAYLPIAARAEPLFSWGEPVTAGALWRHVTGREYQVNLFSQSGSESFWAALAGAWLLIRQYTPAGAAIACLGMLVLWRRDRQLLLAGLATVLIDVLFATNYHIAEDGDAYFLPTILVAVLWLATGMRWLLARMEGPRFRARAGRFLLVFALPVATFCMHRHRYDRHQFRLPLDYARDTLAAVEPGGLLLTDDWQIYSPLLYLQHVESFRPDAAIIDVLLLRDRPWYQGYLRRAYPWLTDPIEEELDRFAKPLDKFDRDIAEIKRPDGRGLDPAFQRLLARRYKELLEAICNRTDGRGVYFTPGLVPGPAGTGHLDKHGARPDGRLVPAGIVLRLHTGAADPSLGEAAPSPHGLSDGTVPLDNVLRKVRRAYALGMLHRANYLGAHGDARAARSALRRAAEFDPEWDLPKRLLSAP